MWISEKKYNETILSLSMEIDRLNLIKYDKEEHQRDLKQIIKLEKEIEVFERLMVEKSFLVREAAKAQLLKIMPSYDIADTDKLLAILKGV